MDFHGLQKIEPPILVRQKALNDIRDAIISGSLRPGTRLIERELCQAMGISRASVREVLRQLEAERLITMEPRRGPAVARLTLKDAAELYEIRGLLETMLVEKFTAVASDVAVAGFRVICEEQMTAARDRSIPRLLSIMVKFTNHLARTADHQVAQDILGQLHARISTLRVMAMMDPGRIETSVGEIRNIIEAVEKRDPALAGKAMRTYVANACRSALNQLAKEEASAPVPRDQAS